MSSRPRRSAAARASETISVQTRLADESERQERSGGMASRRSGRSSGAMPTDSPRGSTVKVSSRSGAAARQEQFEGGEIVHGTRNRGGRKNYVVDSSPDDDEEEEEEADIDDEEDEDAEGEDDMDVDADADEDAEGEEDAEGDIDMGAAPPARPTIKVSRKAAPIANPIDDDNDDLSDPGDSDPDNTMNLGGGEMDAEGEEIEVAGEEEDEEEEEEEGDDDDEEEEDEDAEGEEADEDAPGELDSDEDGSRAATPDVTKMTKRQRARFEDEPHEFMKLSDGAY